MRVNVSASIIDLETRKGMEHMSLTLTSIDFFSGLRMEKGLCDWPSDREVLKLQDSQNVYVHVPEAPKLRGYALRSPPARTEDHFDLTGCLPPRSQSERRHFSCVYDL
jgi:hypothetical protein